MQTLAVVADALCKLALDKGVDILRFHIYFQLSVVDIGEDAVEPFDDLL